MNIAFDMRFTATKSRERGIGRYAQNLVKAVAECDKSNSYHYFCPKPHHSTLDKELAGFIKKNAVDVFHFTSPFEVNTYRLMKEACLAGSKSVVTLYDVIPLIFPGVYFKTDTDKKVYQETLDSIRTCDIILAISETTKKDAVCYAGLDPAKIRVISGGVDEKFQVIAGSTPPSSYGITKPYVLYTGGDDFRKNIGSIIQAFASVTTLLGYKYQLVLAGRIDSEKAYRLAAKTDLAREDLIMTGYIPDEDLLKLYNCAELFLYPSLYEGFGLPLLEAMACGLPVLTSESLSEISGSAAYPVNAWNPEEIASGLLALLTNPELRRTYTQKGLERVKQFQWPKTAQKTAEAYKSLFLL